MKELKISNYLKKYYHLDEKKEYKLQYLDATKLLVPERIDLGAKLYYIHAKVTGKNKELAKRLYAKHIMTFQDGIVQEAGNSDKKGMDCYFRALDELISVFSENKYDPEISWIPVDCNGIILDGAHRVACAIYFNQKLKVLRLNSVKAYVFDYRFFKKRGLEKEYLKLMAVTFAEFHRGVTVLENPSVVTGIPIYFEKDKKNSLYLTCTCTEKSRLEDIRNVLGVCRIEERGKIKSSFREQIFVKCIRFIRNIYTRNLIILKRILGMPT